MKLRHLAIFMIFVSLIAYTGMHSLSKPNHTPSKRLYDSENKMIKKTEKTDKEWKEILTPAQYQVLRKGGTERAFTGKYNDHYKIGIYTCAACGNPLFNSETKYDHGGGWPSFNASIKKDHVEYHADYALFSKRTEVRCSVCGSHLGHVFDDGPGPTHKHYCINSEAMNFNSEESQPKDTKENSQSNDESVKKSSSAENNQMATFAAGCFWGVENKFRQIKGVLSTRVGYAGGKVKNPTYRLVCSDKTGHAEAVEITYDPSLVTYSELLEDFFRLHDPTQLNKQGPDVGTQYRSAIFYHSQEQKETALKTIENLEKSKRFPRQIVTEVKPAPEFYEAEDYHQKYYEKLKKKKGNQSCL